MHPRAPLSPTARSRLARKADRAATDRAELDAVLDAGLVCHLGLVLDGAPVVLPTGYGRDGDTLYLHGSTGARSMREAAAGIGVSVAVTIVDGVVYARSLFHHSMNYRSAVVHGVAVPASGEEKLRGLRAITEHLAPGSWEHARQPDRKELAAVSVLAVDLTESSVKVRSGPPVDDEGDVAANRAWAGVLPVRQVWGAPVPAPELAAAAVPAHVAGRVNSG